MKEKRPYRVMVWLRPLYNSERTAIEYRGHWVEVAACEDTFWARMIGSALTRGPVGDCQIAKIVEVQGNKKIEGEHFYYPDKEEAEREKDIPL